MKRRRTKKDIRIIERLVGDKLEELLSKRDVDISQGALSQLNAGLASLVSARLQLDYPSLIAHRWVDDLEWSRLSYFDTTLSGEGKIWWGFRTEPAAAMVSSAFVAALASIRSGRDLNYTFTLTNEGVSVGSVI